jgi:serine/threonine-protein phosphatase PP1 catalytic subunit
MRFSPICDLLWADPSIITNDFSQNIERGVGYLFGPGAINAFLEKYDFDLICRSHQVV